MEQFEEYLKKYRDRMEDKEKYDRFIYPLFHELNQCVEERLEEITKKLDARDMTSLLGKIVIGRISPRKMHVIKNMRPVAEINTYISDISSNDRKIFYGKEAPLSKQTGKKILFSFYDPVGNRGNNKILLELEDMNGKKIKKESKILPNTLYHSVEEELYKSIKENRIHETICQVPLLRGWWDVVFDPQVDDTAIDYYNLKSVLIIGDSIGEISVPIWNVDKMKQEKVFGDFDEEMDFKVAPYSQNRLRNRYIGIINLSSKETVLDAYINVKNSYIGTDYFYTCYDADCSELKVYTDEKHMMSKRLKVDRILECSQEQMELEDIQRFSCLDYMIKYGISNDTPSNAAVYDIVHILEPITGLCLRRSEVSEAEITLYLSLADGTHRGNLYVGMIEKEINKLFLSYKVRGVIDK